MKDIKDTEPVEIFSGTAWQVEMVKSLLANADIEAFVIDGIIGTLNPWYTAPGGAGAVRIFVSGSDYERAKQVVDEYEENFRENG